MASIVTDRQSPAYVLDAVGQPEDEVLDRHGAVRAPTHLYRRLEKWGLFAGFSQRNGSPQAGTIINLGTFFLVRSEGKVGQE